MNAQFLEWFNPLSWAQKLASLAASILIVLGLVWWGWSALGRHFTDAQDASYKKVETVAREAKQKREALNDANFQKAKDEKIKQLEVLAADGKRLRTAYERLQNDLRARTTSETDLTACVQRARALDDVQQAVGGFAERVVQEADRHVADKVECTAKWPR